MEQQGRETVRAHQRQREEAWAFDEDCETHRRGDGEQGALFGRPNEDEEEVERQFQEAQFFEEAQHELA